MCGIFAILNQESIVNINKTMELFMQGKSRGPDNSVFYDHKYFKSIFGFHRLAINGLNNASNQPIEIKDIVLMCNGEIYNYRELYQRMNVTPETGSDCEVIIHLYLRYGIEQTLSMIDGEFAFVLYDKRMTSANTLRMYVARDQFGVKPLYYLKKIDNLYMNDNLTGVASELKCLDYFVSYNPHQYKVEQFRPSTYSMFETANHSRGTWSVRVENMPYCVPSFSYNLPSSTDMSQYMKEITQNISFHLNSAVMKRCIATERPIACLLSGGLDSSLITALVNDFFKKNNSTRQLETYSIGLAGSEDLKYARIVADYLGTKHNEIVVSEKEMFEVIPSVIYAIESYDTTTVRASIGNYLLGKYISTGTDAKVIFNGDGSDELCGGYLYMNKCPDDIEFDKETRRLLSDIHMFDVLRSDKSISSHGLEPRPPFLDRSFVNYYLSIPPEIRNHNNSNTCEKFLLRNSFSVHNYQNHEGKQLLPDEILWRRKEAFSDGVSGHGRSLFVVLQEHIAKTMTTTTMQTYNPSIETEKLYYKNIFSHCFPYSKHIVSYYWMPRYTNATDPSARTLDIYNTNA